MKKLIAILVVMIVLIGAVFAADSQSLTVTANIAVETPAFVLKGGASDGTYDKTAAVDSAPAAQEYSYEQIALNGSIIANNLTAYFQVLQSSKANLSKTFNFSVTASKLVRRGHLASSAEVTAALAADPNSTLAVNDLVSDGRSYTINKSVTISTAAKVSASENTYLAITPNTSSTAAEFSATYSGYVNATAASMLPLATFSVTWEKDEAAMDGFYCADVTLTVEAN